MREKEQVSFGGLVVVWLVFVVSRWLFGRFVRVPSVVRFGFGRSVVGRRLLLSGGDEVVSPKSGILAF